MQFNKNDQRFDLLGVVTALSLVVAVALLAFVLVPQMVSQDMSAGLDQCSGRNLPNRTRGRCEHCHTEKRNPAGNIRTGLPLASARGGGGERKTGSRLQCCATVASMLMVIACASAWQANSSALPSSIWWRVELLASTASSKRVGA